MREVTSDNIQSASNPNGRAASRIRANNDYLNRSSEYQKHRQSMSTSVPWSPRDGSMSIPTSSRGPQRPPSASQSERPSSRSPEDKSARAESVSSRGMSPPTGRARKPASNFTTTYAKLSSSRRHLISAQHMDADIDALSKVCTRATLGCLHLEFNMLGIRQVRFP